MIKPNKLSDVLSGGLALLLGLGPLGFAGTILPAPISFDVKSEVYNQRVVGDGARSFLRPGVFRRTNYDFSFRQSSDKGLSLSSQLNLQDSDDPLIMGKGDRYKALGGFFALEKTQNYRLEAGYMIPKASRATLTATVLGLGGYYQMTGRGSATRLTLIGGQTRPPVDGSQFQRGVVGATLSQTYSGTDGNAKFSGNLYRVEDLPGSIDHSFGVERTASFVYSAAAETHWRNGLGVNSELAFAKSEAGTVNGNSLRISPSFRKNIFQASAGFERNSPRFINPVGSAAADLKKVDGAISLGKVNQLALTALYSRDNIEGQAASTAKNQLLGASAKVVPFERSEYWKNFLVNIDYNINRSQVLGGLVTSDSETRQLSSNFSINPPGYGITFRTEYLPLRDFKTASNNRDTYNFSGAVDLKLKDTERPLTINPALKLSIERSKSLATNLIDQGTRATVNLNIAYSDTINVGLSHDFQQKVVKPSGRKFRNNNSQMSGRFLLKTKIPLELGLSAYHKHFYDTGLNAFTEEEIRGTISAKF